MKFEDMPVRIPNEKKAKAKLAKIKEKLENAQNEKEALRAVKAYFDFNDELETDCTIISIKYSINTTDEEIVKANDVVDEVMPVIGESIQEFEKALFNSKFRKAIEAKYGTLMFKRIEVGFKTFSPEIIPELVQENKLTSEYSRLMASAKLEFKGEVMNLMQIGKYLSDKDPETRMAAAKLYYGFLDENDEKIGQIYDDLVHLRDTIAHKLGFKNYVELGYLKLGRLDYNSEMVHGYREQIKRDVVPVVKKLRKRQAARLGIKNPIWLDYNLEYLSGNAKPAGDTAFLVKSAAQMYDEMSPESGKFFHFMIENNLMDLDAKAGKAGGGYMTYIPRYKSPFIFANSNGSSQDVDTLTHEVGHAFQGYLGANIKVPGERMPTLEACEIDSMSMEFFAWPWMNLFFGEQADKYRFSHLDGAISFLPYGAEVDDFQHFVYENPNATHEERCAYWSKLEKEYRPRIRYTLPVLKNGRYWMRQSHIFGSPFYYIDYTLAQVLALQFKCEMDKNREKAWKKYIKLLKMGGKYPFLELIERAHLRNPFIDGNIKKVIKPQVKVLDSFDDMSY